MPNTSFLPFNWFKPAVETENPVKSKTVSKDRSRIDRNSCCTLQGVEGSKVSTTATRRPRNTSAAHEDSDKIESGETFVSSGSGRLKTKMLQPLMRAHQPEDCNRFVISLSDLNPSSPPLILIV